MQLTQVRAGGVLAALMTVSLLATTAGGCKSRSRSYSSSTTTSATTATDSGTGTSTTGTAAATSSASGTAATTSGTAQAPPPPPPTGSGLFVDGGARLPDSLLNDWTAAIGDVDGDGRADLVIGTYDGLTRLLLNKVTGFVESTGAIPALTMKSTDVHLIDMDGDADLDLVVAANYQPVRVFRNDGLGRFTLASAQPASNPCLTYKVGVGDVNGDGRPDVLMANADQASSTRGLNLLLLNEGTGALRVAPAAMLPAQREDTNGVALFDADGDGDRDAYLANFGVQDRLWINDGQGTFRDETLARLPDDLNEAAGGVVAADFSGDGKPDLLVCNEGLPQGTAPPPGQLNTLLINDGTGRFVEGTSTRLPADMDATWSARAADLDGDGWTDLVVSNLRAQQRLYLNRQGVFVDMTGNLPAAAQVAAGDSLGLAVGDLDGNQTLDVVWVRRGLKPWLFLNVPR